MTQQPNPTPVDTGPTSNLFDREKTALSSATDTTKQLITLSTAVIAFTVTFRKELLSGDGTADILLTIAWILFAISILGGVVTLMALTGELQPTSDLGRRPSIRGSNVVGPSIVQVSAFVVALILIVAYGAINLDGADAGTKPGTPTTSPAAAPRTGG